MPHSRISALTRAPLLSPCAANLEIGPTEPRAIDVTRDGETSFSPAVSGDPFCDLQPSPGRNSCELLGPADLIALVPVAMVFRVMPRVAGWSLLCLPGRQVTVPPALLFASIPTVWAPPIASSEGIAVVSSTMVSVKTVVSAIRMLVPVSRPEPAMVSVPVALATLVAIPVPSAMISVVTRELIAGRSFVFPTAPSPLGPHRAGDRERQKECR